MGLIIDTSALVTIERSGQEWKEALSAHMKEDVAMPAVVWAEILVGVRMARNAHLAAQRRARLEQIRLRVPIIDFDAAVAEHYADIWAECAGSGKMIPQNDLAVAATARSLNFAVLVGKNDESHFRSVRNLKVVAV